MIRRAICFLLLVTTAAVVSAAPGEIEIVESVPSETALGSDTLRDAPEVWLEMIGRAEDTLDICSFYFSDDPDDDDDALDRVLAAVATAAGRGVRVRMLSDKGFDRTYPEISARMNTVDGVETRLLDARELWGGVQHAKYFIVDAREFFLGSQNWDWRALEHIRELGVRVRDDALAAGITCVFETDWAFAAGATVAATDENPQPRQLLFAGSDTVSARLVVSPASSRPGRLPWDLPRLVELIDSASATLCLQLLSYNPGDRDGNYFVELENALRAAAARGVEVRIILSNWAKRSYMLPWIKSLAVHPGIEVRFTNIPGHSGGFIPFARVEHPKYLVVDNARAWVGTSNWAANYFHESRNLGLLIEGAVASTLVDFFDRGWNGPYAETVDPCGDYAPPRRQ